MATEETKSINLFGCAVDVEVTPPDLVEGWHIWCNALAQYGDGETEEEALADLRENVRSLHEDLVDDPDEKLSGRVRGWKRILAKMTMEG